MEKGARQQGSGAVTKFTDKRVSQKQDVYGLLLAAVEEIISDRSPDRHGAIV